MCARSKQWCVGGIYRPSFIGQPIQKIISIGCITSVDTNNVPGIRGVPPLTRNPNHGEIWFCVVRLPNLDVTSLDAAASLDAVAIANLVPDLAFSLDADGGVPVIIPNPW
jgi:hypothetical protein